MELNTEPDSERLLLDDLNDGRVARITFNDPAAMNAMTTGMLVRLGQALDEIEAQPRVRAAFLTGSGDRAFCVGANLKERQGMTPETWTSQHRVIEAVTYRLRNFRKPIFAAVNGLALGGGLEKTMNTDFMIASDNARFGQPEVKRGIIPGAGGTQWLP
ncbi:MAG: enoyl-CoA hydratase/isomerase family protein, partial [Chloroflexota bacterium]|nr:enoyl-CoA hydratase/isomerase family protein [Chloroflexota bacterium]